jgi:hypothetical protein
MTFTNSDRALVLAILFVVFIGLITTGAVIFERHQLTPGVAIFLWSVLWWFIAIGTAYGLNNSDLLVDDDGLARIVLGKPGQRIGWSDVALIREYSQASRADGQIRHFVRVYPRKSSLPRFRLLGSMLISDRIDSFDELVSAMNTYISKHSIHVETNVNGLWQPCGKLSTS